MRGLFLGLLVLSVAGAGAAAAREPYPVRPEVRQAEVLIQQKDYAGAIALANKALSEHPDDPVALAVRGNAEIELGDYPAALRDHVLGGSEHDWSVTARVLWSWVNVIVFSMYVGLAGLAALLTWLSRDTKGLALVIILAAGALAYCKTF